MAADSRPFRGRGFLTLNRAGAATLWYLVATLVMTWPLITKLGRDLPWDLGDPLLNCWIIGWDLDHLWRFVSGDFGALHGYWTANIYHPATLTLAYSEHLTAQAIQVLPVYALTGNLILCYDLLFLSTFVLSGLGMYLLVRELCSSSRAAFVAGLIYAFAPYRIGQFSHLQVLSSQWMPFVLFGLHRYFATGRRRVLVGTVAALVAQNLSCGYFMMYFAPFVAGFVLYEVARARRWRDGRMWIELSVAATAVFGLTWPFVAPYLELRALGFEPRTLDEVIAFSADVYSYLSVHDANRLYGASVRVFPKAEGELFPGLIAPVLAMVGLAAHAAEIWIRAGREPKRGPWPWVTALLFAIVLLSAALAIGIVLRGGFVWNLGPLELRATNIRRPLVIAVIGVGVLAIMLRRVRALFRGLPGSRVGFFAAALVAAFLLSLGPVPQVMGRRVAEFGPYYYLFRYVPGFDGLRVPARYAMIVALFLAVLSGFGAESIERRRRQGGAILLAASVLFLGEATAAPIGLNINFGSETHVDPPARIPPPSEAPPVYRYLQELPREAVIAEFPFGDLPYELRYMYYSTMHWKRLVNGYSGGSPKTYADDVTAMSNVPADPDTAWSALVASGATHAIVHEGAYREGGGRVAQWLADRGAREIASFERDRVFELPVR